MNWVEVVGHLAADPEQRFTPSGQKLTSFRIADNQKRGEKEETIWWSITVWGDGFEGILAHFKKGSLVIVRGEMREPRIYQTRDGQNRIALDLTARHLSFSPSSRTPEQRANEMGGSYPNEDAQKYARAATPQPQAAPASHAADNYNDFGNVEFITPSSRPAQQYAPQSVPGGFMPGRGSANLLDDEPNDNLPF